MYRRGNQKHVNRKTDTTMTLIKRTNHKAQQTKKIAKHESVELGCKGKQLQFQFELILTKNKTIMLNLRNFYI